MVVARTKARRRAWGLLTLIHWAGCDRSQTNTWKRRRRLQYGSIHASVRCWAIRHTARETTGLGLFTETVLPGLIHPQNRLGGMNAGRLERLHTQKRKVVIDTLAQSLNRLPGEEIPNVYS